ncbi:MAG: RNA methyltransferase [Leptospiraceae bacterium]|nr:RNA methyltransferase [Leptospiraceae bacterium]
MAKITSFSNEKIKFIQKLKSKKDREENSLFVIEGYREIKKAILGKVKFHSLFYSSECFLGENEFELIENLNLKESSIFELSRPVFEKISYRDRPDGLICLAKLPEQVSIAEIQLETKSVYLVIEGVEKPGNLGTILRTAEGAGVKAVFVADPRIDLYNPNVIRASTGTIFTLPVFLGKIDEIIALFKKSSFKVMSVTPEAEQLYFKTDLKQDLVFLFGSEQYGLSDYAKLNSDLSISIPMKGEADSLNLAMSVGILLYDTIRQRY